MKFDSENRYYECQFDSIVGLTHNFAGLAYGNVASAKHQNQTSYPRQAALQGLAKMEQVAARGIFQAILPPLLRPRLDWLRLLGFTGDDVAVIQAAGREDPVLLAAAYSASSMWAANAATVSPSPDTDQRVGGNGAASQPSRRVHFSPANLSTSLHRSIEADQMSLILRQIFADPQHFVVHDPLPGAAGLSDEGAANHTRLSGPLAQAGLEVFVYGRDALNFNRPQPARFPARQTLQASQAIARRHGLAAQRTFFIQQNPQAIDAGVFHNDVIAVGNQNVLLIHQAAWCDQARAVQELQERFAQCCGVPLQVIQISNDDLSLDDAVQSYLFNSQLISEADSDPMSPSMRLISPSDCRENPAASATIQRIIAGNNPIAAVDFVEVRQSMNNGGGPACLRLRVVLSETERQAVRGRVWLDPSLHDALIAWVEQYYPERLEVSDLAEIDLWHLAQRANHVLEKILGIRLSS